MKRRLLNVLTALSLSERMMSKALVAFSVPFLLGLLVLVLFGHRRLLRAVLFLLWLGGGVAVAVGLLGLAIFLSVGDGPRSVRRDGIRLSTFMTAAGAACLAGAAALTRWVLVERNRPPVRGFDVLPPGPPDRADRRPPPAQPPG